MNFSRFRAETHILRVNCAEMAEDGPGEPAYKFFKHRTYIFNNLSFDFLNSRSLPYGGLKFKYCCKTHYYSIAAVH